MITKKVVKSYSKMTEQYYQKSLTEKDLNLQMLRSQINPHFLYNTLDTMRMTSLNANCPPLATMCELLAKILRYGVSEANKLVTVEEENAHLDEYIRLINLRYTNVSINTNLEPGILSYKILKLLLQPLVENSINHGIIDDTSNGSIQIWGYEKDKNLIFTVSDNGNGMEEERLTLLRDYLEDKNTAFNSIGLKNIKKRIQLYYGKEYDLSIDSRPHQGTTVTIIIPVIKE
jgi:two-component system sensor histidine kinase YesM